MITPKALLQRLHADNAIVALIGDDLIIDRVGADLSVWQQDIPPSQDSSIDDLCPTELDTSQDHELSIEATVPFHCGHQLWCFFGENTYTFTVDFRMTLRQALVDQGLRAATDMTALSVHGESFRLDEQITQDVTLHFMHLTDVGKQLLKHGMPWTVCKSGSTPYRCVSEEPPEFMVNKYVCVGSSLFPLEMSHPVYRDTVIFILQEVPVFVKGWSHPSFAHSYSAGLLEAIDREMFQIRPSSQKVQFVAPHVASKDCSFQLLESMLQPLVSAISSGLWTWVPENDVLGSLCCASPNAAPVSTVLSAILRSVVSTLCLSFHIDDTCSSDPGGLCFCVGRFIAVGIGLERAREIDEKFASKSFCSDADFFCDGQLLDIHSTLGLIGTRGGVVLIEVTTGPLDASAQGIRPSLRLVGAGKTDTWRESKSLGGKELIQHGWSVGGLDETTTTRIRAIGLNQIFVLLRTPHPDRRWNLLIESAKNHKLPVVPEDPIRIRAATAIQKAVRKARVEKLCAKSYRISPDLFVDSTGAPVAILEALDLKSTGICLMNWDVMRLFPGFPNSCLWFLMNLPS